MNSDAPGGAVGPEPTTPTKPPGPKRGPAHLDNEERQLTDLSRTPTQAGSRTVREFPRGRSASTTSSNRGEFSAKGPEGSSERSSKVHQAVGRPSAWNTPMHTSGGNMFNETTVSDGSISLDWMKDKASVAAKIQEEMKESATRTIELLRRLKDLGSISTMNSSLRLALEEIASHVITAEDGGIGKSELFAMVASQQKVIASQQEVSSRRLGQSNATLPEKTTENRANHEANGSGMTPSANPVPIAPRRTTKRSFAAPQMRTSKHPGNPTQRHSAARLILRCTPPITIQKRLDTVEVRNKANKVLEEAQPQTAVRVALASYTDRGNITLVVTGESKSVDLMPFATEIGNAIALGHAVKPSHDCPWYKVIIHAASTLDARGNPIRTAEQFAEEIYQNYWLSDNDVQLADGCRFLASPKELKNKSHAAFVMTFEKLEDAKYLVEHQGGLYFSGKWCRADKFEDRQQVRQCERCLSLHHGTKNCRENIRCRFCKGDHASWNHHCTAPSCGATGPCQHSQCVNCPEVLTGDKCHGADDRRCPEKLRLQGLVTNSRAAKQRSTTSMKRIDDEPEQVQGAIAKPKTILQRPAMVTPIPSVPALSEEKTPELLAPENEDEVMEVVSTAQSAPNAQPILNVYRCPRLTRALLHTKRNEFDIALFQEPAWTRIAGGKKGPVAHPRWKPVIPCEIGKDEQPGVMAYLNAERKDFQITMRTDLLESKYGQILEIRQARHRVVLIANLYNVPASSSAGEWIVEKLPVIQWPQNTAIILTGDWNLHHEWWEEKRGGSNRMSRNTVEWLREADFMLMNEPDVPTFFGQGNEARTTIDLTFINTEANDNDIVKEWTVDKDLASTSDHAAVRWVIDQGAIPVDSTPNSRYNFKKADVAAFKATLREELDKFHTTFEKLEAPENIEKVEDVEEATTVLMRSLEEATMKAVPLRKPSRFAKDYWTDELDGLLKAAHDAADDAREDKRVRGRMLEEARLDVKAKRLKFKRRVKAVAAKAANDKLEAADPNEVWKFMRWTQGKREYPSPAFQPRGGGPKVVQHQEKCDLLLKELLPEPPNDVEIEMPDLSAPRPDEYKLPAITRGEVRRAIFEPCAKKAPGPSGIGFTALRWGWEIAEDEIFAVIVGGAAMGFHPKAWKHTIGIGFRKPRKESYDKTKSWRFIQLEEAASKVQERVVAQRLTYLASLIPGLIPNGQFGGIPGRSTQDAAMTFANDVESAWARKLVTSALTFDIAGAFDHVSHPHLIKTLLDKKIPLEIVKWVSSFISEREMSVSLDGIIGEKRTVKAGIPQGSPISPILFIIFSGEISKVVDSFMREHTLDSPAGLILFMDDGMLYVSTESLRHNATIIRDIWIKIVEWGLSVGIEFDWDKKELMHYTRRNKDKDICPGMTIPSRGSAPEQRLEGLRKVKWLGFILDRRLSFSEHVKAQQTKAQNALGAFRMLANTQRGLRQESLKILYHTCVMSIMTYGSAVWWKGSGAEGSKGHLNKVEKVQREATRWITGAFKTTSIRTLEIEAGIMPMAIHLDSLNEKFAIRLNTLHETHPLLQRLPKEWRGERPAEFPPPIELKRGRERNIKPTRLTRIAELSNPEWERVQPFLSPPWRRTRWEKDLRGRMKISLPIPGEPKGDAAMRMSKEIEKWEKDPDRLLVFTDGSLIVTKDSRRTGAGMVAYQGRQEIWTANFGLGNQAEVYDAEMAGLGVAAKTITNILRDRESGISAKRIHFLADNSAAIQTIFEEKPRGAQHWSTMFRNAVLQFLDESEEHEVEINWVPGHQDIKGNEKSDEEAKKGSSAAALRPFTSLAHAKSMARAKARMKWRAEWARGTAGSFALADRCPPSTEPRPHFFKLPRRVYGLVTQARSGHAFMGEYYRRFVPSEETGCPCGEADPQTRRHIIQECGLYDAYRHILEEEVPDLNLADILGSDRGICALAEFIAKSGAFKKAG